MPEPKILIALRTHVWNEAVELAFAHLKASRHELVVTADETHGPVPTPAGYEKLPHSTGTFEAMGLPLYPNAAEAMWFNGDYPLFDIAEKKEFDYLFMVEGDSVILGDIDDLLDRLIADGLKFSVKNFGKRLNGYRWKRLALAWFTMNWENPTCYGGIFPATFISRDAIDELKAGRLLMAEQLRGKPEAWLHCEPYAATQLGMKGFPARALSHYLNVRNCTAGDPMLPHEVNNFDKDVPRLLHPIVVEPTYSRKLNVHYKETSKMYQRRLRHFEHMSREKDETIGDLMRKVRLLTRELGEAGLKDEAKDEKIAKLLAKIESQKEKLHAAKIAWRGRKKGVMAKARDTWRSIASAR